MLTFAHADGSATESHRRHPDITVAADAGGKFIVTTSLPTDGAVRKVSDVTIPKFPPPPPRSAQ